MQKQLTIALVLHISIKRTSQKQIITPCFNDNLSDEKRKRNTSQFEKKMKRMPLQKIFHFRVEIMNVNIFSKKSSLYLGSGFFRNEKQKYLELA